MGSECSPTWPYLDHKTQGNENYDSYKGSCFAFALALLCFALISFRYVSFVLCSFHLLCVVVVFLLCCDILCFLCLVMICIVFDGDGVGNTE